MKITSRYEELYKRALQIEIRSKRLRIQELHTKGQHCKVCLGVTDPKTSQYVFVGLNPGGEPPTSSQKVPVEQLNMTDYLSQNYRYQRNARQVVEAFSKQAGMSMEEAVARFGAVNFSFLHSCSVTNAQSFQDEADDCSELLKLELDLPKLKVLVFTGRVCDTLFRKHLQRPEADVTMIDMAGLHNVDPKVWGCITTLVTNKTATCIFTRHLSPRGHLPQEFPRRLGQWLGEYEAAISRKSQT